MLRMEISALERELRRARQELGASEAGRREVWHGFGCTGGTRLVLSRIALVGNTPGPSRRR